MRGKKGNIGSSRSKAYSKPFRRIGVDERPSDSEYNADVSQMPVKENSKTSKTLAIVQQRITSRCSPHRIMKVVAKSSVDKIRSLDEVRFGGFGHIKVRTIGPEFMAWILSTYDKETKTFKIGDDISFELTEEDIEKLYGLPRGSRDVDIDKCSSVLMVEEARYLGLHDRKGTKESVDLKILKERLTNETDIGKWRILFILYVIGSVLCPVSHQTTSLKYMLFNLTNIKDIKSYNWCKHVFRPLPERAKSWKDAEIFQC